jgi:hypothetical protein
VIEQAAETIAVTMIREAFAHLPADRAASALAMAQIEPLAQMLTAIGMTFYEAGWQHGVRRGRLELEKEMEADWKPVAERVRAQAGSPSHRELERSRAYHDPSTRYPRTRYTGGPVETW